MPASGAQKVLFNVLKTCLMRRHVGHSLLLVKMLCKGQCEPGGCTLLLGPLCTSMQIVGATLV